MLCRKEKQRNEEDEKKKLKENKAMVKWMKKGKKKTVKGK